MRKVLLPQRPALRALVVLLYLTAVASAVVLLGVFYIFTLPWRVLRLKFGGGRRRGRSRSILPQWIEALTGIVEAFALAKMSTAGVKVTKSTRADQTEKVPGVMSKREREPGNERAPGNLRAPDSQGDLPDGY